MRGTGATSLWRERGWMGVPNPQPQWMFVDDAIGAHTISGVPDELVNNLPIDLVARGPDNISVGRITLSVRSNTNPVPTINIFPLALNGFTAALGSPSQNQTFTFSASNLYTGISVSPSVGYEISVNGISYFSNLEFPISGGSGQGTAVGQIYVRIASLSELGVGALNGQITLISSGLESQQVTLTGNITEATSRPVTFFVDMITAIAFGRFNPSVDTVQVRGEFNNWVGWALSDDNSDGIYSGTFLISGAQGLVFNYKFYLSSDVWEDDPNRTLSLGPANTAQLLDTVFFNREEAVSSLVLGTNTPTGFYVGVAPVTRIHLGELQIHP